MFSLSDGGTNYEAVYINASSTLLRLGASGGFWNGTNSLGLGSWHHVGFVRNGTGFTVYLDGNVEITQTTTISVSPAVILFGGDTFGWLNGRLADMRVWNAELTQTEIQTERRFCNSN